MRTIPAAFLAASVAWLAATAGPAKSDYPPAIGGGVVVPYYGAVYGPPAGLTAADARRVIELLESIDRRLGSMEEKQAGLTPAKTLDVLSVASQKCVTCHVPGKAEEKGGGFILFADDAATALKPLSLREKSRIKEAVLSGMMPPSPRKLSVSEKSAFESLGGK